jgi:trans-aconitate 2-methyltransferase
MPTRWDAETYDRSSQPQQAWAAEVLERLRMRGIAPNARVLDVGCGTGRVTEALTAIVPRGTIVAVDASQAMVELARKRLGARAQVLCQDALEIQLDEPVDAIVSTATLHWVTDHERLWRRLADVLRDGGMLEIQCGGEGNIDAVRATIERVAAKLEPRLLGFCPWEFASPAETESRLRAAGFRDVRCWLEPRPTHPPDPAAFVPTSILAAHLERIEPERRERFAAAVVEAVALPLDYVRLNVSATKSH